MILIFFDYCNGSHCLVQGIKAMPSIRIKDLSLAKSVGDLNKLAQLQDKITKNANPKV